MNVDDRVRFKGPVYKYTTGLYIGKLGTVKERAGHHSQKMGEERVELITVHFDGDDKPTVLDINRIEPADTR